MTDTRTTGELGVADIIHLYGECLQLVPMDPHFHQITIGLYVKGDTGTVWTFSRRPGAQERIEKVRDQMILLGGMEPVRGTHNQLKPSCGNFHLRPVKFLLAQAVGKDPEYSPPAGEMKIKDTKTSLILSAAGREQDGRWVYQVSGEGDVPNIPARLRLVVAGFVRYGEMEKISDAEVSFPCGWRHDQLVRILLPYSRNVSGVESMMEAEALRGQMTTGTLGFTPL